MQRIQMLGRGQRIVLFISIFGGGLLLLIGITLFLVLLAINSSPREESRAIQEEPILLPFEDSGERTPITVTVREFARFEDDDAFPGSIAIAPDGRVFSGSYGTGAVYAIAAQDTQTATIIELDGTRERIGAITGMTIGQDGRVYALDRLDSNPQVAGGTIWQIDPDGTITDLGSPVSADGFLAPGHITIDGDNNLYITDRGTRTVWRYNSEGGDFERIWQVPEDIDNASDILPTGIDYDASTNTLIVTDSEVNVIFRLSLDGETAEEIYRYDGLSSDAPSFDGVAVDENGRIYLAALGVRRVMVLLDGELYTLAENFRQVTDIAVDGDTIYAANLDGRALVLPGIEPQLPFSIDIIKLEQSANSP